MKMNREEEERQTLLAASCFLILRCGCVVVVSMIWGRVVGCGSQDPGKRGRVNIKYEKNAAPRKRENAVLVAKPSLSDSRSATVKDSQGEKGKRGRDSS